MHVISQFIHRWQVGKAVKTGSSSIAQGLNLGFWIFTSIRQQSEVHHLGARQYGRIGLRPSQSRVICCATADLYEAELCTGHQLLQHDPSHMVDGTQIGSEDKRVRFRLGFG